MIHTKVNGPIMLRAMVRYRYFITFFDDYPRFGWVELPTKKLISLDAFKTFKATIELKLGKRLSVSAFIKDGEYYANKMKLVEILLIL